MCSARFLSSAFIFTFIPILWIWHLDPFYSKPWSLLNSTVSPTGFMATGFRHWTFAQTYFSYLFIWHGCHIWNFGSLHTVSGFEMAAMTSLLASWFSAFHMNFSSRIFHFTRHQIAAKSMCSLVFLACCAFPSLLPFLSLSTSFHLILFLWSDCCWLEPRKSESVLVL